MATPTKSALPAKDTAAAKAALFGKGAPETPAKAPPAQKHSFMTCFCCCFVLFLFVRSHCLRTRCKGHEAKMPTDSIVNSLAPARAAHHTQREAANIITA
jgi:hypothetical protein